MITQEQFLQTRIVTIKILLFFFNLNNFQYSECFPFTDTQVVRV